MTKTIQFEQSISELERIVAHLEQGDLTLEESLKQFEQGIRLASSCEKILKQAEQKVEMLSATYLKSNEQEDNE